MSVHIPALVLIFPPDTPPETRDLAAAALLDFDTTAVHEVSDTEWRVFFRTREQRDRAAGADWPFCTAVALEVSDEDWARRSQQDLKAITVGSIVVAPPWDVPEASGKGPEARGQLPGADRGRGWHPSGDRLLIVIEPSTGFGTGHHATTRLCLLALQRIDVRGKRVLDVGTGSGILAIAAAKLGASSAVGVDHDADALAAAAENVRRNAVDVTLSPVDLDLEASSLAPADVVLANLTGAMLQRAASALVNLARAGVLIVSGLLDEEAEVVRAAFAPRVTGTRVERQDGWTAFTFLVA